MTRTLVVKVTAGRTSPSGATRGSPWPRPASPPARRSACGSRVRRPGSPYPGRAEEFTLPLATPLADLLAVVREAGTVTLCTQCAARRDLTEADVLPGIRIAGAAGFVEESLAEGAQALVY